MQDQGLPMTTTTDKPTAEELTRELNCDIAALVIRGMKRKGWTKEDLAKAVALHPATINSIVYANHDSLSVGLVGLLLHVLDMRTFLVRAEP
jgi:ribosome-binding protein aMBF1 (putative translation factor)